MFDTDIPGNTSLDKKTAQQQPITQTELAAKPLILNEGNISDKRAEIKRYFNQTYDSYELLFETLKNEQAFYQRPCSLRHPLIFYFGHTATFFTNKLVLAKLLPQRINPKIESMCAIGVDEMSWDDLNDNHYDWPSVADVRQYRNQVRSAVNSLIDSVDFSLPIDWQSPMWPIIMGIEHERIHLETSSVLIRQLELEFVQPHQAFPICPQYGSAPENSLLTVPAGEVKIDHHDPAAVYGWDNEYGQHHAEIESFKAAQYLVSNQEFLEFVDAGGYQSEQYWCEEGNRWRQFTPLKHPTFWVKNQQAWSLRCMTELIPMPWNWPVEINYLEAKAFCNWKAEKTGKPIRLPSEDEYLRLLDHTGAQSNIGNANINLQQYASSTPVDQFENAGFYDVIGNVWQWTETPIYPFEGFKVHPLYDDFTVPTFDQQHNIFKGGSWISTGNEINGHSRYAFRRHFFQHAGFRYIESTAPLLNHFSSYETDDLVAQYCEFHYGEQYFGVKNFPKNYAQHAIQIVQQDPDLNKRPNLKALEVGCSVGRGCFELAKDFVEVTGLDFSARFIQVANQIKDSGTVLYSIPIEGQIMDFKESTLTEHHLHNLAERCNFFQQDACNMKAHFTGYDLIIAANLIDRLYEPEKFLTELHNRLNPGGIVMICSPYTWMEVHTQQQHWLGGYKDPQSGENVTTLQGLQALLEPNFDMIREPYDMEFVIRETQRKFQHSLAEVTFWKKKSN